MKAVEVRDGIYWVGAVDWSIRNFHGYATNRGTTYGAYLILDEKITLVDSVKAPFTEEMLECIEQIVNLDKIDIIIMNHVEMDHSGALPALLGTCPNATIYTSGMSGIKGLAAHYGGAEHYEKHKIQGVKSGESVSLGSRNLHFIATPMLHWPDNMLTYCPEEKLLFSNDAFGQHYASSERFDDEVELTVALEEAKKYYANILMCYGKQIKAVWNQIGALDIEMILPSHGVIWRSHIKEILQAYETWSDNNPESGAIIVYDSMWHSTEKIARRITDAFTGQNISVKLYDLKENHYSNIIPELLTCKYLAVGSPTLNNQMMPNMAAFLTYLKGLSPKNRKVFAFGSYGWGGQSVPLMEKELQECDFELCMEGIRIQYIPREEQLRQIEEQIISMLSIDK